LVLMIPFVLVSLSCTKQVAGPKGDPGTPAKNGNAKQTTSVIFNQASSAWLANGDDWESYIFLSEITDNVLTKGEVRVYIESNATWWPLPYGVLDTFIQMTIEKGRVKLNCSRIHGGPAKPASSNYRVVIMEPV
jgi:hypothetical protein